MATAGARTTNVSADKWEDDWYMGMTSWQRNLYDFFEQGNQGTFAGVFKMHPDTAFNKTNPKRRDLFESTLSQAFQGHVFQYPGNWWFVRTYLKWNGPRTGNLSDKQAEGIANTLRVAPVEARADWWREYGPRLEAHGYLPDTLGIPIETLSKLPSHTIPDHTIPITSCRSRAKPRKYTDEQYALGMEAAEYAMEAAKDHTGFEEPSGYRFPQFLSFFCQRAKLEDSLQDCKDCVDEYFRRLKEKNAEAAERGLKRHHMGGFAGFKGTRDSLAGAVLEKREGNRANTPT